MSATDGHASDTIVGMRSTITPSRPFEPGTTGWTADDLDNPEIEAHWFSGRYEIVEGVLTRMPPAYFSGGRALQELIFSLKSCLKLRGIPNDFASEADLVLDETRVLVADTVWMSPEDKARQADALLKAGRSDPSRTRILVPPTLVIESVSPGHELHDRKTKRRWYSEFGVPNYWILDGFEHSLLCLVLDNAMYRVDAAGRESDEVRPSLFPGLVIPLGALWDR